MSIPCSLAILSGQGAWKGTLPVAAINLLQLGSYGVTFSTGAPGRLDSLLLCIMDLMITNLDASS